MTAWAKVALCDACWRMIEPEVEPVRFTAAPPETCHRCGRETRGIYIRSLSEPPTADA